MLVMIDNYDSFTYNLVQYFGQLGEEVRVFRNDQIDLAGLEASRPSRLVISPVPVLPMRRGYRWRPSAILPERSPSWGSAWAIRPSARRLGATSSGPPA